jgi:hypothetical protein
MKRQGATVPESGDTSSEGSTYGMPADYVIDPLQKAVFTRGWGRLSDEDLVDYQGRLNADPDFEPDFSQLVDLSGVERLDISAEGVRTIATEDRWAQEARRAFVAPLDEVYGMVRMHEAFIGRDSPNIRIFRELAEARAWLARRGESQADSSEC